ncbi:hypothetical protein J2S41_007846 [Catenuloplanes atrovinosus]|uniref:Uncharacterized protein n=1 Tax=Catenuloplanes atrovinosus TaxID=137266 RepID=A0AAE4CEF5_9ACTN|nr:hypothetical protein [Catenuloplanes atrovinosus]
MMLLDVLVAVFLLLCMGISCAALSSGHGVRRRHR